MVTASHSWEEETKRYLLEIQTELVEIENRLEELQVRKLTLTREAEAFDTALAVHLRKTGRQEVLRKDIEELLNSQSNHKERIKRIAEQNNGMLKIGLAADILYNNRILKTKTRMHAYRIVYGLTIDMVEEGIFQKSGPAEFRLVGIQPKLPVS